MSPSAATAPFAAPAAGGQLPDVAIVGAGLSGRLLAWRLARAGLQVALYDSGAAQGRSSAAWIAAAMLAPVAEAAVAEPLIVDLGVASLARWPLWLAELTEPVFFRRKGTLVVWHAADQAEALQFHRRVSTNSPAWLRDAPAGSGPVQLPQALDGAAIGALEPALSGRFRQGSLLGGEGQLDNRQLLLALDNALQSLAVPVFTGTAMSEAQWPRARLTFDCRGLGAKSVLPGLRGIRGEVARIRAPGIGLTRPVRLLHPRYPLYIVPRQNDQYVVGATEIESEDSSPVSVRSALELLSAAFSVHPGFGEARIEELNAQCRPTLPDHRPALIFQSHGATPCVALNGLYRHGFMIAPEVVEEAVALAIWHLGQMTMSVDTGSAFSDWSAARRWSSLWQKAVCPASAASTQGSDAI